MAGTPPPWEDFWSQENAASGSSSASNKAAAVDPFANFGIPDLTQNHQQHQATAPPLPMANPQRATQKQQLGGGETDVMMSLLGLMDGGTGGKSNTNANTNTIAKASAPPVPSAPVQTSTFGADAFDFLNLKAPAASPPPPKQQPQQQQPQQFFNPIEDASNPFTDDVMFPVTNEGIALEKKLESAESIPGFDEFVSEQLKTVKIESAPTPTSTSTQQQQRLTTKAQSSASTASVLPTPPAPPPSYEEAVTPPSSSSLPSPPPPPAYDDVVKQSSSSSSSTMGSEDSSDLGSPKNDLHYLWPMPFVQTRLKPLHSERAAALRILSGGQDILVAGANAQGGIRIWKNADASLNITTAELKTYGSYLVQEDSDSAVALDVPNRVQGKVTCIRVDEMSNRIFAGYSTGEVTCWDATSLKFLGVFQAHRNGSVNAIVLTTYGDIWTGSSRGSLRIWKNGARALPKSGQNSDELRRNGERAHGRIQALLYVPSANLIWSCGVHTLALWNATTGAYVCSVGELEKEYLNSLENAYESGWSGAAGSSIRQPSLQRRTSMTSDYGGSDYGGSEYGSESDFGSSFRSEHQSSSKRATQQLGSFTSKASKLLGKGFKLGKKAVAKSVDTVYNATSGVASEVVSSGETVATVLDANTNVWVVYSNGQVEIYSKIGKIVKKWKETKCISCICTVGPYVWAGLVNGQIKVWDDKYEVSAVWNGHQSQVLSMCCISTRVYTLSLDGSINGWHYKCPIDWNEKFASGILQQSGQFMNTVQMTVFAGTWNVNQMKLNDIRSSLPEWLKAGAKNADIALVGLEEIEMGGRSVAESIVKEAFVQGAQEKGNLTAQTWLQEILGALCKTTKHQWTQVGSRQLSGILLGVYVRDHLKKATGEIETCSVARGVMGVGGNKGTVAVSLTIFRRKCLFLCSHFAAHQNAVAKRNEDYMASVKELRLSGGEPSQEDSSGGLSHSTYQESSLFQDAHLIIWVGDFNYRVDMPYNQACQAAYNKTLKLLQKEDQCIKEMAKRNTFRGFKEGALNFMPTYKFDKRTSRYDTSEKQRIPAWCDRVLYRTKKDCRVVLPGYGRLGQKYVRGFPEEPVSCCLQTYDSCHDIVNSDHKPVFAVFNIGLRCVDESSHRQLSIDAMERLDKARITGCHFPNVEFDQVQRPDAKKGGFTMNNRDGHEVAYEIVNAEESSAKYLPHLVLLLPNTGLLKPKSSQEITVAVNSDPSLSQDIHRLDVIHLRVNYWIFGMKTSTKQSKVIATPLQYERYFHSI